MTTFPLFATGLFDPRAAATAPALRVGAALPDPPFDASAQAALIVAS
jgi:hypothetical protein